MIRWSLPAGYPVAAVLATIDRRFVVHMATWAAASLLVYGLVAAIIPNPVFGRQIPAEPFAIVVWFASAPLLGLLGATYSATAPPRSLARSLPLVADPAAGIVGRDGTALGSAASFGAFLAIGCPVCNKLALVLLGTNGAMTIFAPLQPVIGAASLVLLAGTLAWRFRLRTRGGACRR
ncbi:MAG: hypothetical protein ACSLFN_13330 [Candidatus Limnocylindrales bacterium]